MVVKVVVLVLVLKIVMIMAAIVVISMIIVRNANDNVEAIAVRLQLTGFLGTFPLLHKNPFHENSIGRTLTSKLPRASLALWNFSRIASVYGQRGF